MTIHASAYYTNVERSLMGFLVAQGINAIPEDVTRLDTDASRELVRVQIQEGPEEAAGLASETHHAIKVPLQALIQCRARGSDTEIGQIDAASQLADRVMAALRLQTVIIYDYLTDPTGATLAGEHLQSVRPPSRQTLPVDNGWQRRLVRADFFWFLRQEV